MERGFWEERWRSGNTPWDKGEGAPPLEEFLRGHKLRGRVLVPGCGSGHDVRLVAGLGEGVEVLGLDISEGAVEAARGYEPAGGEAYRVGDYLELPEDLRGGFDWVIEHTCFCALDPVRRADYVRATVAALVPGGHFLGLFFMDPGGESGPPFGATPAELDALFGGEFVCLERYVPETSFASRRQREEIRYYRKSQR